MRQATLELQERYYDLLKEKEELEEEISELKYELASERMRNTNLEDNIRFLYSSL